jgi:hypothetical protein
MFIQDSVSESEMIETRPHGFLKTRFMRWAQVMAA